jgi:2-keto-4-pentenoate hydratase/2-oxohepta-3-ene-1,7-dioic acid hydratase in catechol pathway
MKFANVKINGVNLAVTFYDGKLLPINSILPYLDSDTSQRLEGNSVDSLIKNKIDLHTLKNAINTHYEDLSGYCVPEENVERFLPCIEKPGKIIGIGINYRRHAKEANMEIPKDPVIFSKFSNSLAGNNDEIAIPKTSKKVDYEGELGIIIGERAEGENISDAHHHIFGYFVANDISARDLQFQSTQWLLGKTLDKFAPIGPYAVTSDEVENPNNLKIRTYVNGNLRQDSNTSDMIFNCDYIVSYLSKHFPLEPCDIILTGTPEGVIMGMQENDRKWLKKGDVVEVEIEKIGKLRNKFTN